MAAGDGDGAGAAAGVRRYSRTVATYSTPAVTLVDSGGAEAPLREVLAHDGPVALQFVFTTCPAVCPVQSATLAALRRRLAAEEDGAVVRAGTGLRLVSISIDPEHDTPERLRAYGRRYDAGPDWLLLTGRRADVDQVLRAFDAESGNKMEHLPLTFLRTAPDDEWVRLEGFPSAADLVEELRRLGGDPRLGARIYRQGVLPSGAPLLAAALGDVELSGAAAACASCHRPSGHGSRESAAAVPPVTAPALFSARAPRRELLFRDLYQDREPGPAYARARLPRSRRAYDAPALAAALRTGLDPGGRRLDPLMPRYRLDDASARHLIAYLRTLGAEPDPGVDAEELHLAAVVDGDADAADRAAMEAVLAAYVRWKNADTAGQLARPAGSPWHRDGMAVGYRRWVLHTWVLDGDPAGWTERLERAYAERPVFTLVSGLGERSWRPVHEFCERHDVPCLFPNAEPPAEAAAGDHAIYLARGIEVEAEALAAYLRRAADGAVPDGNGDGEGVATESERGSALPRAVVQVYRAGGGGVPAARALRRALAGDPRHSVRDHPVAAAEALSPQAWADLLSPPGRSLVVLWLDAGDLASLGPPPPALDAGVAGLVASARLLGGPEPELPAPLRERLLLTYPYEPPARPPPGALRARSWLRARGVVHPRERIQLQTWLALSTLDAAMHHLVDRFSRDLLVEAVEHETERMADLGLHPRLSLGPGQRFASTGCYLARAAAAGGEGEVEPVTGWIVP